jgi:hypothetical protein
MSKIDLSRLSSTSFERLIRALAFAEMGPAGVTFSSGADGARDFTYDGKIPGFEGRAWDGYLIVQAKFRANPQGGQADIDWIKAQLSTTETGDDVRADLACFRSSLGKFSWPAERISRTTRLSSGQCFLTTDVKTSGFRLQSCNNSFQAANAAGVLPSLSLFSKISSKITAVSELQMDASPSLGPSGPSSNKSSACSTSLHREIG